MMGKVHVHIWAVTMCTALSNRVYTAVNLHVHVYMYMYMYTCTCAQYSFDIQ